MVAPKLPDDEAVVTICREAYCLGQEDYKAAVAHLKAAVQAGTLQKPVQRTMLTWLAEDGKWDEARAQLDSGNLLRKPWAECTEDEKRIRMMKEKKWSNQMLDKNIRAAGGNIDDLRGPMDDNWDKMLAKGPPAWFEEALDQHQNGEKPTAAKAALEDAEAALAAGPPSGGAPTAERAAPPVSAEDPAFEASAAFAGARPGQVFKTGPQGVGYYSDPAQVAGGADEASVSSEGGELAGLD